MSLVYGVCRRSSTSTGYVLMMAEVAVLVSLELKPMRVRVIIVGAGFAGLTAAHRLAEDSRFSVTLLETSGRVGGRVRSASFPDHGSFVQDLGVHVSLPDSERRREELHLPPRVQERPANTRSRATC